MDVDERYEFLEKVGSGSFATVYRARDLELGREVAVKQIHEHYLDDPEQLDRYWDEAQLLASLQHPNVVTIFDIQRERGWLILELMQTNLSDRMTGRQMDLRALRTAIAHSLRALKYLHSQGIVHGDIKPSNMMIDARRRVKLGDFGLARRVSDDDGSLLKGTTKYMAPESVSDEFGDVGPASDLYSLGFAAYELMCGPNFESLFPGLSRYGRNKQVAWMTWHAAPDRRMPDVSRVLEGVPDDLAQVIQRLCEKDQSKRYQSADDALSDLKIDLKIVNKGEDDSDDEAQPLADDPERKKRLLLAGSALAASLIVCLFMLFYSPPEKPAPKVHRFEVVKVDAEAGKIRVVTLDERRSPKKITIPKNARISLEHFGEPENKLLEDLQAGDRIEIEFVREGEESVMKITAARPYISRGRVVDIDMQEASITIALDEVGSHENLTLRIPKSLRAVKNLDRKQLESAAGKREREKLLKDNHLDVGGVRTRDFVEFAHLPEPGGKRGRVVSGILYVSRLTESSGRVADYDSKTGYLTVVFGSDNRVSLPLSEKCQVALEEKGARKTGLKPDVIRQGDIVDVKYDTVFKEIHITRGASETKGAITAVHLKTSEIVVRVAGGAAQQVFHIDNSTKLSLGGESAAIEELRDNDTVIVISKEVGNGPKTATTVTATRPSKVGGSRAVVIGVQTFDDKSLEGIGYSKPNVDLLAKTLESRYAISKPKHLKILDNPTRDTMKTQITETLRQSGAGTEVIIYLSTHAFVAEGKTYLAGKKIDSTKVAETGMPLDWLIKQLEECRADTKILLLDCSHTWKGMPRPDQPSTAKMMQLVGAKPKTAVVIASCDINQRGLYGDQNHGAFAKALAESYAGAADADRNLLITADELFKDLAARMKKADLGAGKSQTPVRFPAK